ncbi:MAG TPA: hypothetical protein VJR50_26190 [Mycobacterium sp.]|jgi:hypothetical protein|nr:hypothetical protein [Mycobacterium sp.]
MLAELGRRADAALRRGTDAIGEAVHVTVLHARRIAGAVSVAAFRVKREAEDLVWDYQDVAADLRRPGEPTTTTAELEAPESPGPPRLRVVGSDD